MGVNPVLTLADGTEFAEGLKNLDLSVAFSLKEDETALLLNILLLSLIILKHGVIMNLKQVTTLWLNQPFNPLFDTKQFQDVLLSWTGNSQSYYDAIQENWSESILGSSKWNKVLHDGFLVVENSIQNNYQRADLAVEASVLAAQNQLDSNWFYIQKPEWVMVNKPTTLGYKNFLIQ